ncbi:MAG: hypothetical protein EPO10_26495 [Reyranella sp.]|uniref:hypothetical protein n=1 Tax=Reyranella sp. TaxID=1929291 RepID=UPI0012150EF5|nr:hypothetical protein [Reyranella sp.]TAJ97127.1 MAG: hypothetical protein EPO41_03810 [Reyranella sp.]TBR23765.1 MAG: hypothetical protein EPO10_26495 [Reyranella sp.]
MADYVKIKMPKSVEEEPKEYVDKKRAKDAANALFGAFGWDQSPEGSPFWLSVYERLMQMSKRGY